MGDHLIKLIAGNSNLNLAAKIAAYLGIPITRAKIQRFADLEIMVEIQENIRGSHSFVVQSTSFPANDHLAELLVTIDALRRASARRITAVIPYFGYSRQDRKPGPRTPIGAKVVANLLTVAGADSIITVDLHSEQVQGFFDLPMENVHTFPVIVNDIRERFGIRDISIVSPDIGGAQRAEQVARNIGASVAFLDQRRERPGELAIGYLIGKIDGSTCIVIDDMVDSAATLINATEILLEHGATKVYAYITHGILSGSAATRMQRSQVTELVITDSIQRTDAVWNAEKIRVFSIAPLLGEVIKRFGTNQPTADLW